MAMAVKIGNAQYLPTFRKSRPKGAVHMHIVAHIPYRGLTCARVVKQIIWIAVVIEVIWHALTDNCCYRSGALVTGVRGVAGIGVDDHHLGHVTADYRARFRYQARDNYRNVR